MQWLVPDHLGTPRIIVDETGSRANVKRHDYLPFGEELFAGTGGRTVALGYAGDGVRKQFTQYERDAESGLDFAGARFYASTQGRFTSIDPLMASASTANPQTFNRYSYVSNSPLTQIDPTGMFGISPGGSQLGGVGNMAFFYRGSSTDESQEQQKKQDTLPKDLKDRVQDIACNCADFLNRFFDALGPNVHSRDVGTLYDRVKKIELSEAPFKSPGVPREATGLASGSESDREIYIKPAAWNESENYQEFRWNSIATNVLNELAHHARDSGTFSDSALDKAAKRLMSPAEQIRADAQMKQKGYAAGTIGHRAITANCKATNPYGPPPKR